MTAAVGPSGYSPSQWALGRGIKLPCQLLGQHGNLRLHEKMLDDREPAFRGRVNLLSAVRQSVAVLGASRKISEAFLAESRTATADPAERTYRVGDQVFCWKWLGKHRAKKR